MRGEMKHRLRGIVWVAIALLVAIVAGGAVPRGRRAPVVAPGRGDGRTTRDVAGVDPGDDRDVLLRPERSNTGAGRTYTLTYRLTDAAGNTRTLEVPVAVPRTLPK